MDELIRRLRNYAKWAEKRPLEIPILLPVYLRQAADELEKRRWVSVEERLPEDKQVILVWGPSYDHIGMVTYYELWGLGCAHTRWMPLPEAPEKDKS